MKLPALVLAALAPVAVFAHPAATPAEADHAPTVLSKSQPDNTIQKRANNAVVTVDGLRYRKCPRTSCTAVGQYPIGTRIQLDCYTTENTTPINGDYGWARVTGTGYWVALAWGEYVQWEGFLPYC